jgi:hypothetical protein
LLLRRLQITRSPGKRFKRKAKKHEEECDRFISVVDMIGLAVSSGFGELSLSVKRIENELAVLVDEAGNGVYKVEP